MSNTMQDEHLEDLPDTDTEGTTLATESDAIYAAIDAFNGGFEDDPAETEAPADANAEDPDADNPLAELGDLDTDSNDESKGIRSLREAHKRSQQELKELRQKLKEVESSTPTPTTAPATPPTEKTQADEMAEKYSASDILEFLGRYEAGEAEGDPTALDRMKEVALDALERKTPAEILEVQRRARRGEFGGISRDIQAIASEALATLAVVGETRKAEAQAQDRWAQERQQSLAKVFEIDGIRNADGTINQESEAGKQFVAAGKELVSLLPEVQNRANAPEIVLSYMQMKQKSEAHDALVKENNELKARLRRFGGSLPAGTPTKTGKSGALSPEAQLRQELAAMGFDS